LISYELRQVPQDDWSDVLARHAEIHQVDFALLLKGKLKYVSRDMDIPEPVTKMASESFHRKFPRRKMLLSPTVVDKHDRKPRLMIRTKNPTRYWAGVRVPVFLSPSRFPVHAVLLAVSGSITGNGFFFDPLPWIIIAAVVMLISVLLWIPLVRNITRPLARMTRAAETIAGGSFDVRIKEPRFDEIGRLGDAINHMTFRLDGFVKGQKRFLGDVAHELGSPIARIQIGLGILEQAVNKNNQKQVADVMEDVAHMSKLVNELLSFSRAEMNTAKIVLRSIDLFPVLQRAMQREIMPHTKFITNIDSNIRCIADPELLSRALANIIRNAIKYAGKAGPVQISAKKKGNNVEIEIRDSGRGVPDDLVEQLFEPFFRPESSRDRCSGGVGLGLAIVKTCIETCKGTVSARNLSPKGFAVTITLRGSENKN
jgi:two-component system sensor histidine kinase CpxA